MKTKLSFRDIEYKVDSINKVIICTVFCDTNIVDYDLLYIYRKVKHKLPKLDETGMFTISAKSRCHKDDEWNEIKGKRIAESKAKKKAFKLALRMWQLIVTELNKQSELADELFFANYNAYIRECEHLKKLSE